jgi:flagellin-like protein
MAFTKKNDEAVSPVIGVILMVAVTVILAAVIAAFVFGMAGNLQKGKVVAFTATNNGTYTTITNMGGQDVAGIEEITYTINGVAGTETITSETAGTFQSFEGSAGDRIILLGSFKDGTKNVVLLDTRV